jgi:hypothetical protein
MPDAGAYRAADAAQQCHRLIHPPSRHQLPIGKFAWSTGSQLTVQAQRTKGVEIADDDVGLEIPADFEHLLISTLPIQAA